MPDRFHPLPLRPEFSIIEFPGFREYRLENKRLCCIKLSSDRSGPSGEKLHLNIQLWELVPLVAAAIAVNISITVLPSRLIYLKLSGVNYYATFIVLIIVSKSIFFPVLYESVVLLPPHGIQLETHRGFLQTRPLISRRRFFPSACLNGIYINEGLRGWNILYYLVILRRANKQSSSLKVAYQHLLPDNPILLQVYQGIYELILCSPS